MSTDVVAFNYAEQEHWKAALNHLDHEVYMPQHSRHKRSKVLSFLDEFPFLEKIVPQPLDVFEVFARGGEGVVEVLVRQAAGITKDWMCSNSVTRTVSFYFFSKEGYLLGLSKPTRRIPAWICSWFDIPHKTQPPLGEVIQKQGLEGKIAFIVEVFTEAKKVRRLEVFKMS